MHENKVHLNKAREYKCHCGRVYTSSSSYYAHKHTAHATGEFSCTKCEKVFNTPVKLKLHEARFHGPKTPCEVCGVLVGIGHLYTEHMKSHQSIKCSIENCGKEFESKNVYRFHMRKDHCDQKEFPCPSCNLIYNSKYHLGKHISACHRRTYTCEVAFCEYTAKSRAYITKHYKNHDGLDNKERTDLLEKFKKTKYSK